MQAGMLAPALAAAATLAALCTHFIQYAAAMASGDVREHMRAAGNLQESCLLGTRGRELGAESCRDAGHCTSVLSGTEQQE